MDDAMELQLVIEVWRSAAMFLSGVVAAGIAMLLRGDFLGRRAADDVERRLSDDITQLEARMTARVEREMEQIEAALIDIRTALRDMHADMKRGAK